VDVLKILSAESLSKLGVNAITPGMLSDGGIVPRTPGSRSLSHFCPRKKILGS